METSQADGGTRSGLLWEVERILIELNREREREHSTHLPQVLIMENVPEVVGSGNLKHFQKWRARLEEFGYSNYDMILNAKNYGIPQNRRRCFMISILGEHSYSFPKELSLRHLLKDFLEKQVDEKYYLSQKHIERISNWKAQQKPLDNAIDTERERERVSPTLTARGAGEEHSGMVLIKENIPSLFKDGELVDYDSSDKFRREHSTDEMPCMVCTPKFGVVELGNYSPSGHNASKIVDKNGLAPTVMENHGTITAITDNDSKAGGGIKIMEATKKGYKIAQDGDGIDISSRMINHRGTVQKGLSQTLTCKGGENVGVVVKDENKKI